MPRWPKRKARPGVDEYGRTPLWYHAAEGDLAAVRAEIAAGADPNIGDDVNYSLLHAAVQEGRVEIVHVLLGAGADPNKIDDHGNGPLWTAVLSAPKDSRIELITILLRAGANPDQVNRYGHSPRDAATEIAHGLELPFVRAVRPA